MVRAGDEAELPAALAVGGVAQRGVRVADPVAVAVAEADRGVGARRHQPGAERHALVQRGGERERLERRPGLHADAGAVAGVGGEVDPGLAALLVGAEGAVDDHRLDLAGARLDHRLGGGLVRGVLRRDVPVHRALRGLLRPRVHGGADREAAALEQLLPVLGGLPEHRVREDLALHVVAEERRLAGHAAAADVVDLQPDGAALGLGGLGGVDPAERGHPVQDGVAALPGLAGMPGRVVGVGVADDPGEQGRLGEVQLGRVLGEVVPGRGLDAVRAVAVVGDVEVAAQDLVLAELLLHRHRVPQFADLAGGGDLLGRLPLLVVVGLGEQEVLHVLLGDAGAALRHLPAAEVAGEGPQRALQVDGAVLVEAAVLDGEHRRARDRRDLVERDVHPVLVEERRDLGAVGGEDRGPLRDAGRRQVHRVAVEPACRVAGADARRARGGQQHQRDEHPGEAAERTQPAQRAELLGAGRGRGEDPVRAGARRSRETASRIAIPWVTIRPGRHAPRVNAPSRTDHPNADVPP